MKSKELSKQVCEENIVQKCQSGLGYCLGGVLNSLFMFAWIFSGFLSLSLQHSCTHIGYAGVSECVCCNELILSGPILSEFYHLVPSDPANLIRAKQPLKMNESFKRYFLVKRQTLLLVAIWCP